MTIIADWSKFSKKQKGAITGYIKHGEKYKAYKDAYDVENQTKRTTQRACYTFFSTPKIKAVIDQIQREAIKRASIQIEEIIDESMDDIVAEQEEQDLMVIDAQWVLKRAALLADFNIVNFIRDDDDGTAVYDFSTATDDDWYCIQEYTTEKLQRGSGDDTYFVDKIKIKGYDKLRALELVGKHIDVQAFKEQTDITSGGKPIKNDWHIYPTSTKTDSVDGSDEQGESEDC